LTRAIGGADMTLEEIKCFCEGQGATVRIESPVGTITCSSKKGIQIGATLFAWQSDPPPLASQQELLDRAAKFCVQPKFGDEKEISREKFEQLLKT
jgi:hypothetical protein